MTSVSLSQQKGRTPGRLSLLSWLNSLLEADVGRVQDLGDCAAYLQLLDALGAPVTLPRVACWDSLLGPGLTPSGGARSASVAGKGEKPMPQPPPHLRNVSERRKNLTMFKKVLKALAAEVSRTMRVPAGEEGHGGGSGGEEDAVMLRGRMVGRTGLGVLRGLDEEKLLAGGFQENFAILQWGYEQVQAVAPEVVHSYPARERRESAVQRAAAMAQSPRGAGRQRQPSALQMQQQQHPGSHFHGGQPSPQRIHRSSSTGTATAASPSGRQRSLSGSSTSVAAAAAASSVWGPASGGSGAGAAGAGGSPSTATISTVTSGSSFAAPRTAAAAAAVAAAVAAVGGGSRSPPGVPALSGRGSDPTPRLSGASPEAGHREQRVRGEMDGVASVSPIRTPTENAAIQAIELRMQFESLSLHGDGAAGAAGATGAGNGSDDGDGDRGAVDAPVSNNYFDTVGKFDSMLQCLEKDLSASVEELTGLQHTVLGVAQERHILFDTLRSVERACELLPASRDTPAAARIMEILHNTAQDFA